MAGLEPGEGISKPTAVLWVGGALIAFTWIKQDQSTAQALDLLRRKPLGTTSAASHFTMPDMLIELGILAAFYLVARLSDGGGSVALAFLAAVWLLVILKSTNAIGAFFGKA